MAVYGILGLIVAIILIRIIFKLLGVSTDAAFVASLYNTSDTFVNIFQGIYPTITAGNVVFELPAVVAIIFYSSLAFLVSKSITAVIETNGVKLLTNIIDTLFKLAEFLLLTRFIFKLTNAGSSQFTQWVYNTSALIYEPFKGALPAITITNPNIIIETSTLIAIIVIIIFDVVSENIIRDIASGNGGHSKGSDHSSHSQEQTSQAMSTQGFPTGQPQHITINMPPQPPAQNYYDQRSVHVAPHNGSNNTSPQGQPQALPSTQREV